MPFFSPFFIKKIFNRPTMGQETLKLCGLTKNAPIFFAFPKTAKMLAKYAISPK